MLALILAAVFHFPLKYTAPSTVNYGTCARPIPAPMRHDSLLAITRRFPWTAYGLYYRAGWRYDTTRVRRGQRVTPTYTSQDSVPYCFDVWFKGEADSASCPARVIVRPRP